MIKTVLIGKAVEVAYNNQIFKGTITNETKNMIYLEAKGKIIGIVKKNCKIRINNRLIEGKLMVKRLEDRVK